MKPTILNTAQVAVYQNDYQKTFGDSDQLTKHLFNTLVNPKHFFGIFNDEKKLVSAGLINKYFLMNSNENLKLTLGLIGGILTNPEFRKQGYAKKLLNFILETAVKDFDILLIQAYNWDVYASWDFLPLIKTVVLQLPIMVRNFELNTVKVDLNDENSVAIFATKASLIYQKFAFLLGFDYFILNDSLYFRNYCKMSRDEGCTLYYNHHAYVFVRDGTVYNLAFVNDEGLQALLESIPEKLHWIETTALVGRYLHHWSLNQIGEKIHAKFYNSLVKNKNPIHEFSKKNIFGYLEI